MGETTNTTEQEVQGSEAGVLSRFFFVLFILPIIAVYPIQSLRKDDDELLESFGNSPLTTVPLVRAGSILTPLAYGTVFVGLVFGFARLAAWNVPGFGVPGYTSLLVVCVLVGVWMTFLFHASGMERELTQRVGLGAILSFVMVGWVVGYVWYTGGLPVGLLIDSYGLSVVPGVATFLGAMAGNGYIVKAEEIRQNRKRAGDDVDTESFVRTSRRRGEELPDGKGQDLLESFAEDRWVVPNDLSTKASIQSTRKIDTYRDIVRGLWVDESTYKKTVPDTQFSAEKSKHRSDYNSRRSVAPSGFSSKTYTFYVPGSKETESCDQCKGRGKLDCTNCGTRGSVSCSSCSGSGKVECRDCRGAGTITVDETCNVCRGSGETASGWECSNCGGYGSVEKTKNCPNCNRRGYVSCSSCGGSGSVTCSSCGGRGTHDCGKCDACGRLTSFKYAERAYSSETDVSHRNNTVPVSVIENADGTLVDRETDDNPSKSGLYRRQEETRHIPVITSVYEYLGDKWEVFGVENGVKAVDFPRDFHKQFRIVQVLTLVCFPVLFVALL